MFQEIPKDTFDQRERRILKFWKDHRIFQRSVEERSEKKLFSFYDGPPFATGLPHYGHLLAGTIKDVIPRYKTMKGFCVPRRFGWDCHGLPIENEIEKMHNLTGAHAIENFGISDFNEECRKIVLRYTEDWQDIVTRMGRWVDFGKTWHTMDLPFMESVWWVFKQLVEKGFVYEGFKVMPFSAKLGTPLSNFEAGENYKDVDDPALTVALALLDEPNTYLLIWTTTPWTLVSNLAVMAGPEITYAKVQDHQTGNFYILANNCIPSYFKEGEYTIKESFLGKKLAGLAYKPLFNYFADRASQGAFKVILEENVATDEGTGLVHSAPAFGEMDFYACQKEGIELVCPVDNNGRFTSEIPEYQGQFVKEADKDIARRLKQQGALFKQATIRHRYPFCWRSDTPLIYKAVQTWFVAVEKIRDRLLKANEQIHWTPSHVKQGRFGKWLENARDWAISRNRYWGTPIPIWKSEEGDLYTVGSIKELEELTKTKITDLHRHYIDQLTFEKEGKTYKRITEVFDCWFESGSMPYAQMHYPFENKELFNKTYPADFIGEGLDQTRGWFYTLTILSTILFDKPAFKNVIVNGIILAEDGSKMSKRLKNYPDPMSVVYKYGADAIRLYMLNSPAVKAEDLCFSEAGVELILRQVLIPLWNAYTFFVTYARIYQWMPDTSKSTPKAVLDRWMISLTQKLIKDVEEGMDDYDLSRAVEPFVEFVDQLTNWYIRRSRRRFWSDADTPDRREAFQTLYYVLVELSKIAAPFVPFISEAIFHNLRTEKMPESIHLCQFPEYHAQARDEELEEEMSVVQKVVSLGHALRKEHKLKVRQPLPKVYIASSNPNFFEFLKREQHLVAEELNVKSLEFTEEEDKFVILKAKPNFRSLGKKVGKQMKAVQEAIEKLTQEQLSSLMKSNTLKLSVGEEEFVFTSDDIQVNREVRQGMIAANEGEITIVLDTSLNEELLIEGLAREFVNKVNTMRREQGFEISDRIYVKLETTQRMQKAIEEYNEYIANEVLVLSIDFEKIEKGEEWDLNGEYAKIQIRR